jgi:hypothetical protein
MYEEAEMDKKAETAARKRLKGKIWMTRGAPSYSSLRGRRRTPLGQVEELTTRHLPPPEQLDGWDPNWGSRPGSWYDPDLAYQDGDWEWIPGGDGLRAVIRGRKQQAAFQIDERNEREGAAEAVKRALRAEIAQQQDVWRAWVLADVRLTAKQQAFLTGEIDLARNARSQMLSRIHERTRKQLARR